MQRFNTNTETISLPRNHDLPTMCEGHADSLCSSHDVRDVVPSILKVNHQWAHVTKTKTPCYFPQSDKQSPKLLWIGCSDSRILEGDITVARPGDVFVHRNIANQFFTQDTNTLAVVGYAIAALGVRNVAIVGHKKCGGVIFAYGESQDGFPERIFPTEEEGAECFASSDTPAPVRTWLQPLANHLQQFWPKLTLEQATKENVLLQVNNLFGMKQTILQWSSDQPVLVHGLLYDFTTGILETLTTVDIKP